MYYYGVRCGGGAVLFGWNVPKCNNLTARITFRWNLIVLVGDRELDDHGGCVRSSWWRCTND